MFFDKREDSRFGEVAIAIVLLTLPHISLFPTQHACAHTHTHLINQSGADMLTVDETTKDPPQEEGMNSPDSLSTEATYINQTFAQQMLTVGWVWACIILLVAMLCGILLPHQPYFAIKAMWRMIFG